ncbi:unnamed protein product [Paramecium sonneborni]|uniref:WD domain, G-beta repeat protein n=1 Tax=Paramecium sonneborni TaxID=65129 RepID=A0A8S1PQ81_9CILI|nr:unnamed protein product [Paramecium sonneborni]
MIYLEKCSEHSEDIVAIDIKEQSAQKRGLCTKCWAVKDKKEVMHIQDSINQINQAKQLLKEDRTHQLQINLENIYKLSESLDQLKIFYIQQIEQISTSIKKWTQSIQKIEEDFMNKVQSQKSNDYQIFLRFIKEEENNFKLNQTAFLKDIDQLIQTLDQPELLSKCILNLKKTFVIETIIEKEHHDEEIQNLNLLCEDHQEKIILFDLSQERTSSKRIVCQYCLDSYSSLNYKSVKFVQNQWREISQNRLENMQNHSNQLKNKIKSISESFGILKKDLIKSLDNANKNLQDHYDEYSIKLDSTRLQMNKSWEEMSKEEIIKILLELSNLNNQSISVDPLLNEYNYQDNQINEVIKDTVLCLQECQESQYNKINGLTNNILIVNDMKSKVKESNKEVGCQIMIETMDQSLNKSIFLELKQKELDLSINLKQTQHLIIHSQISSQQQQQLKPFTYNQTKVIKQKEWCRAIAINKDNSILVVACVKQIKVFDFKEEQLKQTQLLNEHSDDVRTLNFMKKSNQFISGSDDKSIIIWCMNENNQWICKLKLNGHTHYVYCLILNNNEDIIISGSGDQTIKFWIKQNEWVCSQTITDHTNDIYGLSINDQQNKVISCGCDNLILVIEQSSHNQKWNVIQKITVEQYGIRICFINDEVFTFQPKCKEQMQIYQMNSTNKQFLKTKDIMVKSEYSDDNYQFPSQYIKQKCLIICKNGQNLNLIRKKQNGDLALEQSIEFGTHIVYGQMSDDGEYLITWNNKQKKIQIRKYEEN